MEANSPTMYIIGLLACCCRHICSASASILCRYPAARRVISLLVRLAASVGNLAAVNVGLAVIGDVHEESDTDKKPTAKVD